MAVTLAQIINAVEATLGAAASLARSESFDELTEGIQDPPLLQVYPESNVVDITGNTDRSTFGGRGGIEERPTRVKNYVIHADLYAAQRAVMGQDMAKLVTTIDEFEDILEDVDTGPYFGLEDIKAFSWSWTRGVFPYGDPMVRYVGARFVLSIKIF